VVTVCANSTNTETANSFPLKIRPLDSQQIKQERWPLHQNVRMSEHTSDGREAPCYTQDNKHSSITLSLDNFVNLWVENVSDV
jgi:hypothetical protein